MYFHAKITFNNFLQVYKMISAVFSIRAYKVFTFLSLLSLFMLPLMAETKTNDTQAIDVNTIIPGAKDFFIEHKGAKLQCSPVKLIQTNTRKNFVEYLCLEKYADLSETRDLGREEVVSGTAETKRLLASAKKKNTQGERYTVQVPRYASKFPMDASRIAERQLVEEYYFGKYLDMVLPGKIYLSLRPQFAQDHDGEGTTFGTGGSRGGFFYYYKLENEMEFTMQYEGSVDFSGESKFINVSNGENSNRRLSYLSLSYKDYSVFVGKYWSPYYDVAGFTDHFMAFGGQAGGAFNNGTDGSSSGTGRVDEVIQLRTKNEEHKFKAALQLRLEHTDQKNVDKDYQYDVAGSLTYTGLDGFNVGASFAYAKFDGITSDMSDYNIDGNDQSYIVGAVYMKENMSTNVILSYSKNHMTDNEGIYFDGVGAELYFRYDMDESYRVAVGGNVLIPRDTDYEKESDYSIKTGVISLQYTFGAKSFDDVVYIEASFPYGRSVDGDKYSNRLAVGLRYLLQR